MFVHALFVRCVPIVEFSFVEKIMATWIAIVFVFMVIVQLKKVVYKGLIKN